MTPEQFVEKRKYLKNVTPRTLTWYAHSFKRFDGAIDGNAEVIVRIGAWGCCSAWIFLARTPVRYDLIQEMGDLATFFGRLSTASFNRTS